MVSIRRKFNTVLKVLYIKMYIYIYTQLFYAAYIWHYRHHINASRSCTNNDNESG
jgi:hypothetical protein